jgi:uncharacterized membrane protein YraQ (UPF0718 family)
VINALQQVWITLTHNWPFLLASVLISVALRLYIDPKKATGFITRYRRIGIFGAKAAAVTTPFCSCGTTAVILGMMASTIPWAPIVAFMVASPLTSPEELFYSAGIFGWPFALTFFAASIVLGLAGGVAGALLDKAGWLKGQTRMAAVSAKANAGCDCDRREVRVTAPSLSACACEVGVIPMPMLASSACACEPSASVKSKVDMEEFFKEIISTGKQLMKMYLGFAFIGFFLNGLIPSEWISALFGGNAYSVPLAATLGLPFYISTEASLPLIRAMIDGGMSQGAAMAFMISGAGTSVGAIAGALTIARWRVIAVVVATLWAGAIVFGYLFNAALSLGWI